MTAQLAATSERLDTLLAGMNRGQGTLGKFVTDSGLYYDMREVTAGDEEAAGRAGEASGEGSGDGETVLEAVSGTVNA